MGRPAKDVDFFRVWSPDMAYVLGFWWADGCMRIKKNTGAHTIEFSSNDLEHLETICEAIQETYYIKKVAPHSNTYVVSFCSKQMFQDLLKLGGMPRKSQVIDYPAIPDIFAPHFIRGVIDGDGTLIWNGDRPVVQIYSGSRKLLENIGLSINHITGIPAPHIATNRDNWYIKWSTIRTKCLVAWLYFINPGIHLERKYKIAEEFINWHPKKRPNRGTITDQMRLHFADYLPK